MTDRPRVRFAPSPTGYLHVGGARTALFNWLFAHHEDGVFVLRIEDTDRERSRPELTEAILEGLAWLGLEPDEGPHHQADGLERHREDAGGLIERGAAYRCFCTPAELEARRRQAADRGGGYSYDGRCREIPADRAAERAASGEPYSVRFRVPDGETVWDDVVHGRLQVDNAEIEDFVILRSDGTPTYNFAVVSDDLAMRITHVIRGADHISNTPKQIHVYRALDAELPIFCHVPLILGPDGKRLSKRHGATAIGEYRDRGYLPEAMVNFLALLGWSPGDDREMMSREELIEAFGLDRINKKAAVFDHEKLDWLSGRYFTETPAEELIERVGPRLIEAGLTTEQRLESRLDWNCRVLEAVKRRARTLRDVVVQARPFYPVAIEPDPDAVAKHWADEESAAERLAGTRERLEALDEWEKAPLESALRGLADELDIGAGKLIHPLRVALTGMAVSPGIFEVMHLMGRELVLRRIDEALARLREGSAAS